MTSAALFHDRFALAWVIVGAYFVGAIAAWWAGGRARGRERRFWVATCVLLVLLGLNKELDLQTFVTNEGRELAKTLGRYEQRRLFQGLFLLSLAIAAIGSLAALLTWLRGSPRAMKVAAVGIGALLTFVLMRAAAFHHIDEWVTIDMAGLRSGWWIELAGIAAIALSAISYRPGPRRSHSSEG